MDNVSVIAMLTLSRFNGPTSYRLTVFTLTLLCYCVIWLLNVAIIVTVIVDKNLHEPMYIFLCNICINALYGTAGFYPKFLSDLLSGIYVISHAGCVLQGFVLHSSACADFSLLALMAYDRYVAICQPLAYHSVMTKKRICAFMLFAWILPFLLMSVGSITTSRFKLCYSHISKIYCTNYVISKLACSLHLESIIIPAFNTTFYFGHFVFVVWTYVYLIRTCITSKENRSKFMQTCLPHVLCLVTFLVCMLFDLLYIRYGSKTLPESAQNFMAIEFIFIPPILNPLIYGLKLTKIKNRITQFLCRKHV